MAKFLCIYEPDKNGTWTNDLINKHVEHLRSMKHKGVLILCGILKEKQGGLIILEEKSYEEAEIHILQDPLVINKCYGYTLCEFIEGNEENNYLLDGEQTE